VQLEELGKLKKSTSSGTQSGNLPACGIVPQPNMPPHAPNFRNSCKINFHAQNITKSMLIMRSTEILFTGF
jgi:hypothetical protein